MDSLTPSCGPIRVTTSSPLSSCVWHPRALATHPHLAFFPSTRPKPPALSTETPTTSTEPSEDAGQRGVSTASLSDLSGPPSAAGCPCPPGLPLPGPRPRNSALLSSPASPLLPPLDALSLPDPWSLLFSMLLDRSHHHPQARIPKLQPLLNYLFLIEVKFT